MNLKVKIITYDLFIIYLEVKDNVTLQELVQRLVYEHQLERKYLDAFEDTITVASLLDETGKCHIERDDISLTITKKEKDKKVSQRLFALDYKDIIPTISRYVDFVDEANVSYGTLFYIQIEDKSYLVRRNKSDVELYDFHESYGALYQRQKREPLGRLFLKNRKELSKSEFAFMKTVAFPVVESKNIIPEDNVSQETLDLMTDMIGYVNEIMDHFKTHKKAMNRTEEFIPTFILQNNKKTIGFLEEKQLLRIVR